MKISTTDGTQGRKPWTPFGSRAGVRSDATPRVTLGTLALTVLVLLVPLVGLGDDRTTPDASPNWQVQQAQQPLSPTEAEALYGDPSQLSQATLVSEHRAVRPGTTVTLGLHIAVPEGWHTYWVNPGDAGAAAEIWWEELPEGFEVSDFRWPRPERYAVPPLMSYGYGEEVLLPFEVTIPSTAEMGSRVILEGVAEWLFCDEVCLFTDAPVELELQIAEEAEPDPEWAERFADTRSLLPDPGDGWEARALAGDGWILLAVEAPEGWEAGLDSLYFFPRTPFLLEHAAPQPVVAPETAGLPADFGGDLVLLLEEGPYLAELPDRLEGILAPPPGTPGWTPDAGIVAVEIEAAIESVEPGVVAQVRDALPSDALAPASPIEVAQAESGSLPTLPVALLLAFVGGLLLNLMPCVFPVISLKILGFVKQAGAEPRTVRLHGLVFGAGVILSFLALAGLLLAVRAAGSDVGWGFQLQDPRIIAGLAVLLFLLGLNLLGVFDLGTSLTRLGSVGAEAGYRGSFLTGVLATIVATPCTAPFMGAAIGAALVQPAGVSLAIFGGLGLGMATPYMVLSFWPALLERLPRPGQWMETFRQAMAFPMFAVVIWLLWVFGLQTGVDGATALLSGLLLLALGAWLLGRRPGTGRRPAWVIAAVLLLFAGGGFLGFQGAAIDAPASSSSSSENTGTVAWEDFSAERVLEHQRAGDPVFVDFTAAWCLSCQVNKRTVLTASRIEEAFVEHGVVLLRADWTRRDDTIAAALQALGRNGVPVYALYPGEPGAPPELLPEILTTPIVLRALERLPERTTAALEPGPR